MKRLAILVAILAFQALGASSESDLIGGRPAHQGEYSEVIYISSGNARCSATLIGPQVILTAGHCVREGSEISPVGLAVFSVDEVAHVAVCKQAPQYRDNVEDLDFALCKVDSEMDGPYASISPKGPQLGSQVVLMGYGCTQPGGGQGNDGVLRIGAAKVIKLPADKDNWFYTQDAAALCFGDSGGPSFLKGSHQLIGVNSRGNIRDLSLLTAIYLDKAKKFFNDYAQHEGVEICGVTRACR